MMADVLSLRDRVIAVTGGARGIGLAITQGLVALDAAVVMLGRDSETLAARSKELGDRAIPCQCDVASPESVNAAFAVIEKRFGLLDGLINNAAVGWPHRIEEITDGELITEVGTNLVGPILTTRAAVPLLRRSRDPHIINISSESSHDPFPYLVLYAATKSALETLTAGLHHELWEDGIRVTLLRVGQTQGGGFRLGWEPERRAQAEQAWQDLGFKARVAGGAVGQSVERVAEAVAYVLSQPAGSVVDVLNVRAHSGRLPT